MVSKAQGRIAQSYLVCATPRSGSNLLCEALTLTGVAGVPQEYFMGWANQSSPVSQEFLDDVFSVGTAADGVFGVKVMWSAVDTLVRNLAELLRCTGLPTHDVLARAFPRLQYVYITRGDTIRQAVSLVRARQSGRWVAFKPSARDGEYGRRHMGRLEAFFSRSAGVNTGIAGPGRPVHPDVYSFEQVAAAHALVVRHDQSWEQFFSEAGIRPHRVQYEQLVARYDQIALEVLRALGLPDPADRAFGDRVLDRQGDEVNEEWVARVLADPRLSELESA